MPWKTMDVREQRVRFVVAAYRREKTLAELCREFGISRPVGYEWLKRYRQGGVQRSRSAAGGRSSSPRRTEGEKVEQRVVELRRRYPDWGSRKLRVLLQREGIELGRNTIHRILLRHDLVHPEDRHEPAVERFERSAPNELWQMDFKGPKLWHQKVGPLSVIDDHSRYLIVLQAVASTHSEQVREPLVAAFCEQRSAGGDADGPRHAMVERAECGRDDQAVVVADAARHRAALEPSEASADSGQGRAVSRRVAASIGAAASAGPGRTTWLDQFRWEHNHVRPHEALGMQTPASRWRPSVRRYDANPPRWEYPAGARVLKVDSQGKLTLAGKNWSISRPGWRMGTSHAARKTTGKCITALP